MFKWENDIALYKIQGNQASSPSEGYGHGISRVVAGTWGIFSSYSGDGHSELHFIQRSQDTCVVMRATSGI